MVNLKLEQTQMFRFKTNFQCISSSSKNNKHLSIKSLILIIYLCYIFAPSCPRTTTRLQKERISVTVPANCFGEVFYLSRESREYKHSHKFFNCSISTADLVFIPNFSQQQQHTLEMSNDVLDIIIEDCSREYLEKNVTCWSKIIQY